MNNISDLQTKKTKKGKIVTAALFALSLAVVAYVAIAEFGGNKDRSLTDIHIDILYLIPAVGCFLTGLLCETLKYSVLLKKRGYKGTMAKGFKCAVIGKYYDNITPAGAGGQGFQIYELKKYGCDDGTAGALPIIGFLGLQSAFVLIGTATMILGGRYLRDLTALRITAAAGLVFYAFIPVCIIIFAAAPKALYKIVRAGTALLAKVRIVKDKDRALEGAVFSLESYTGALHEFSGSKRQIASVVLLSLIYQAAFMSLPYFVLHFFGAEIGFVTCFCKVVYIYAAITLIFTPGNSGAAEASFYLVFGSLKGGAVFWAMLMWRLLCYYSWLALGAVVQMAGAVKKRKKDPS